MIRVLIVDDSLVLGRLLEAVINGQEGMTVVGVATSGAEGVAMVKQLSPDVVTMDIQMPGMDGFEAIAAILADSPVPIIVVSALVDDEAMAVNFRAYELGAVAVERKPAGYSSSDSDASWASLLRTIRAMHGVRPISPSRGQVRKRAAPAALPEQALTADLVAIGSSTGGPQVLQQLLEGLPDNFPAAVLIVQHLTSGFMSGMRAWLQGSCRLPITIAQNGEKLRPGCVYLAPDDRHLTVLRSGCDYGVCLTDAAPVEMFRPSVTVLFKSLSAQAGRKSVGILLTGMGRDGADGLVLMRKAGATTIVQDQASAVVYSMPGEAIRLDAVDHVMTPAEMVKCLARLESTAIKLENNMRYEHARTDY